ncbi:MAG: helix-turn-helix transcriptional regulator [Roseburia sp.]|jgi:transcriptional regulator with XRE-family HTH domain|nr:helix-turn-helix transcriptional regulator [Roseburia sp.]
MTLLLHRIRDLREDADYTQEYIAHLLHTSQRTYSRYENAERAIPLSVLCFLADFYETSVDYLIGRTDVRTPYPASKRQSDLS